MCACTIEVLVVCVCIDGHYPEFHAVIILCSIVHNIWEQQCFMMHANDKGTTNIALLCSTGQSV